MGIKHRADGGFRKFWALSKLSFGRIVKCFEMPYVSYPKPLPVSVKRQPTHIQTHLVLPDTQANPPQNQKSHFLPTHQE
jgi:hypothetical protein